MATKYPTACTVLVIGAGPAGSLCASALAREGINTVLFEAEKFPRYHVGESMLPSIRHYMRFIGCDDKFDSHGFIIKKGAMFKLSDKPVGHTDFVAAGGPNGYAYNVVRSEADELLFRHAGETGAHVFDGLKVNSVDFMPCNISHGNEIPNPGRAKSATWTSKDGLSGVIDFDYLVDASGRQGFMSTKYLKNRKMNTSVELQNVATWGYWTDGHTYGEGTEREGYRRNVADLWRCRVRVIVGKLEQTSYS